ncbi:hypothetical protein [Roseateles sp. BYS87W]|uniref:Uncharacterized protein n=1 Tax=Pelomonas baiyunensis TaxID=3299026 RepID=A0ABW7H4I1_9BURK
MRVVFIAGMTIQAIATEEGKAVPMELSCTRVKPGGAHAFECEPIGPVPFRSLSKECLKPRTTPADSQGYVIAGACAKEADDRP